MIWQEPEILASLDRKPRKKEKIAKLSLTLGQKYGPLSVVRTH